MTVKQWYEKNQKNIGSYGNITISDGFLRWSKTDIETGRPSYGAYVTNTQNYKPEAVLDRYIKSVIRCEEPSGLVTTAITLYP